MAAIFGSWHCFNRFLLRVSIIRSEISFVSRLHVHIVRIISLLHSSNSSFLRFFIFQIGSILEKTKKEKGRSMNRSQGTPKFLSLDSRRRGEGGEGFFQGRFNFIRYRMSVTSPASLATRNGQDLVSNWPVAESSVPPLPPRTKSGSVIPAGWTVEILPGGGYQPRPNGMASIPCRQLTPD